MEVNAWFHASAVLIPGTGLIKRYFGPTPDLVSNEEKYLSPQPQYESKFHDRSA
jgi:hypothetical protein